MSQHCSRVPRCWLHPLGYRPENRCPLSLSLRASAVNSVLKAVGSNLAEVKLTFARRRNRETYSTDFNRRAVLDLPAAGVWPSRVVVRTVRSLVRRSHLRQSGIARGSLFEQSPRTKSNARRQDS